ncbi:hypothetical protein [Streptomyces sp. NPDC058623]|uniref:hypothetical protein n=1 Tax=Streptomyces sp. NPDC058623 TaxID=3346563 RepID=UPI003657FE97
MDAAITAVMKEAGLPGVSVGDRGGSLSTLVGRAVTRIVTPEHVWNLPSPSQVGGDRR